MTGNAAPMDRVSAGPADVKPKERTCDLLIHHGHVVTMDGSRTVLTDGALAVTADRIVEVGSSDALRGRYAARRLLDAGGGLVHPGFIDPHLHTTFHSGRGLLVTGADVGSSHGVFDSWANELTEDDEHDSALAAFTEALRCGFTGIQDPGTAMAPDAVARAAEAAGIRCSLADPHLWDQEGASPTTWRVPFSRKRCLRLLGGQLWRNRDRDALVRGHVAVYGVTTASDELLVAAKDCARENGVVFASHQSLSVEDYAYDCERFGRPPLLHFADLGIIDQHTVFTHMNCMGELESDEVIASGMTVVWNPTNYLFYGLTLETRTRVPELVQRGGCVALCNDIAKAWGLADEQFIAYFTSRSTGIAISISQLFEIMTLNGARAIGMADEVGSLEAGRRADIVMHRSNHVLSQPNTAPELQTLLVGRAASVDTVLVAGRVVVQDGRCVSVDEEAVFARARSCARRVATRVGITLPSDASLSPSAKRS